MDWKAYISEAETRIGQLQSAAPDTAAGFATLGRAAKTAGSLDERTKEFVALGIAIATRCNSCIAFHVRTLARLGASRQDIVETVQMAVYMGGGPSMAYGAKALEAFDQFSANQSAF